MARDEQEEEREFLADLEARTGRTLADWMAAIAAQGFADKNETIDWLRAQGIPVRPRLLAGAHPQQRRPADLPALSRRSRRAERQAANAAEAAAARHRARRRRGEVADLDKLLAAGKGYRPLYQLLEAEMRGAAVPASRSCRRRPTSRWAPRASSPPSRCTRRSCGSASIWAIGRSTCRCKSPACAAPDPAISHMLVLTDARQVNADLLNLIKAANARVNG